MATYWTVKPVDKPKLSDFDPNHDGGTNKAEGQKRLEKLASELGELQELMFATRRPALLIVFQGMDTAGKDGAINRVLSYVNVQSCKTTSFKVPTPEELSHDFLWRIHNQVPGQGGITLFNRSHYEDVLVVRVHSLAPKEVWSKRYERINEFEKLLAESNTTVLKFFLHISKEEQEKRLLEREQDPTKAWKLSAGDWKERALWDDYMDAYEAVLDKCSTAHAPWRVIPANRKWLRDLAIAEAMAEALRPLRSEWMERMDEIGVAAKQELAEFRAGAARAR